MEAGKKKASKKAPSPRSSGRPSAKEKAEKDDGTLNLDRRCQHLDLFEFPRVLEVLGKEIRHNTLSGAIEVRGGTEEGSSNEWHEMRRSESDNMLERFSDEFIKNIRSGETFTTVRASCGKDKWRQVISAYCHEHQVDPIIEWMDGLPEWDGNKRCRHLFANAFLLGPSPYLSAVSELLMRAIVSRQMFPGCQFDFIFSIHGAQGLGKSGFVGKITPGRHMDWHTDTVDFDASEEEFGRALLGNVTAEIPELAAAGRKSIQHIKKLITRRDDKFRNLYENQPTSHPRRIILFCTANPEPDRGFLPNDPTGNRRWIPVNADAAQEHKVFGCLKWRQENLYQHISDFWAENREQMWAEARAWVEANHNNGRPLLTLEGAINEEREDLCEWQAFASERTLQIKQTLEYLLEQDRHLNWQPGGFYIKDLRALDMAPDQRKMLDQDPSNRCISKALQMMGYTSARRKEGYYFWKKPEEG